MIKRGYYKNRKKKAPKPPVVAASKRRKKREKKPGPDLSEAQLRKFSLEVRARDGYTCQVCGSRRAPQAHHVLSKFYRPEYAYDISNGITLCKRCHTGRYGVHGSSKPKNKAIQDLRRLFRSKRIDMARRLVEAIRRRKNSAKPSNRKQPKSVQHVSKAVPTRTRRTAKPKAENRPKNNRSPLRQVNKKRTKRSR